MAASYLFIPFYLHILGPAAYGIIAFYTLLLTIAALADVGLSATFSREAARQSDKRNLIHLLSAAERVLLIAVGTCSLMAFLGAEWLATNWLNSQNFAVSTVADSIRLMSLMLVPHLLISLYSAGLLGLQRQVTANLFQALFVTLRSGLVILPIIWRPDLTIFFGWQLGATLLSMLLVRSVLVRAMGLRAFTVTRFDYSALRPHLAYAGGMLAITVIAGINMQLDKLLISRFFPLADFGYYSLGSTLAQLPSAIATPIAIALFPRLTAHVSANEIQRVQRDYENYGRLIVFVAALGAFGLALFSREILVLWLQNATLPATIPTVTTMLALGSLFHCLQFPPYYLSLAHGENRLIVGLATITLTFSIPLTILAIWEYGLLGAASVWFLLNFINFFVISTAVHCRHYPGEHLVWMRRFVGIPLAFAFFPLVLARFTADALRSSPFATCLLALIGAGVAFVMFTAFRLFPAQQDRSACLTLANQPDKGTLPQNGSD